MFSKTDSKPLNPVYSKKFTNNLCYPTRPNPGHFSVHEAGDEWPGGDVVEFFFLAVSTGVAAAFISHVEDVLRLVFLLFNELILLWIFELSTDEMFVL